MIIEKLHKLITFNEKYLLTVHWKPKIKPFFKKESFKSACGRNSSLPNDVKEAIFSKTREKYRTFDVFDRYETS